MSNDTEWEWHPADPQSNLPYHLRADAAPLAACSDCGRKSWSADSIDRPCAMLQPTGVICGGTMCSKVRA